MGQRQRQRGIPLDAAERAEILSVAAQVRAEKGLPIISEIWRRVSFRSDRASIKRVLDDAEPPPILAQAQSQQNQPLAAQNTSESAISGPEPPDVYAAILEFAKENRIPIPATIYQAAQQEPPRIQSAPAIFAPKRFSRVAFISDIHLPFENRVAVRLMLDFLADYKPDVVLLAGDIYDFYEISDFDKTPGRITTLQDEFDEGRYFIRAIDELCPEVHFLIGNHEDRLQRVINRNPGLFKLRSLDMQRAAELPERWRIHPSQTHFKLGKLTALHGDIKGIKSAVHPARTLFQKLKRSVIFGHFHRFGVHLDTNYDGDVRGGFANGHLSDVSRVTSWVTCPDWQEGFSTISLCEDGGFAVQPRLIVNHRLIVEGKEYTL